MWNVITAEKYSFFFSLRGLLLPVFFTACTDAGPVDLSKCKAQTQIQSPVHSLSEGPTRGLGIRLTCTFVPQNIKPIACFTALNQIADFTIYGNLH